MKGKEVGIVSRKYFLNCMVQFFKYIDYRIIFYVVFFGFGVFEQERFKYVMFRSQKEEINVNREIV